MYRKINEFKKIDKKINESRKLQSIVDTKIEKQKKLVYYLYGKYMKLKYPNENFTQKKHIPKNIPQRSASYEAHHPIQMIQVLSHSFFGGGGEVTRERLFLTFR